MPYGQLFTAKHINGKRMMRLSDEVLIDLGVSPEHAPQMYKLCLCNWIQFIISPLALFIERSFFLPHIHPGGR